MMYSGPFYLKRHCRHVLSTTLSAVLLFGSAVFTLDTASAQAIIATVNNDPITNVDVEQSAKMLRVLRKPSTPEAAMESVINDRVKKSEADKYKVKPSDADVSHELVRVAGEMKVDPNALAAEFQRAGVTSDQLKSHFGADFAFGLLVQALNKGVEASEVEVRNELAKEGGKSAAGTEYSVRQIVLPLLGNAPPATVEARVHLAEQIRTRFNDCDSGVPMVQGMEDAVIKNPISRTSLQLSAGMRQILDKTPVGHVTAPERSSAGIEMLALCSKGTAKDDTSARELISQKILAAHYAKEEERLLKELRSHAVIQKR